MEQIDRNERGVESPFSKFVSKFKRSVLGDLIQELKVRQVKASGLFDRQFYMEQYPQVATWGIDPIRHFLGFTSWQCPDPGPGFSVRAYLENNPDVAASGANPLLHYIRHGVREKRQRYRLPLPVKDPVATPTQDNSDEAEQAPLDLHFYRYYYGDVAQLTDPQLVQHYETHGKAEGRYGNVDRAIEALETLYGAPEPGFDEQAYLRNYPNVAAIYPYPKGGIVHYLQFGRAEGLKDDLHETYDAHRLHLMLNRIYDLPEVVVRDAEPVRINVLVPAFEFKSMSAGFFGVFQVARFIARCGFRVRLVMFDNFYYNEKEFREKLKGYPDMVNLFDELEIIYIGERKAPLYVSPRDNCVATVWYSAHFARKIMDKMGKRPFLYLIQDYETNFYPGGASYCVAEASYRFHYNALFSSQTLQQTFVDQKIGRFADAKPPKHVHFNNACARYRPDPAAFLDRPPRKFRLAFYSRPAVNRNMFELGALALCEAYRRGIFAADQWEFFGIGLGDVTIRIADRVKLQQMERMNLAEYQQAIGEFDLGICLMASPHPSLLPFDLGGSGALVVTNNFGVKTQAYFDGLCRNVISAEAELDSLVDAITEAVRRLPDRQTRLDNALTMTFPDDWDDTFTPAHVRYIKTVFRASKS